MTNAQAALQAAVAYSGKDAAQEDVLNVAQTFKAWLDEHDSLKAEAERRARGWA